MIIEQIVFMNNLFTFMLFPLFCLHHVEIIQSSHSLQSLELTLNFSSNADFGKYNKSFGPSPQRKIQVKFH